MWYVPFEFFFYILFFFSGYWSTCFLFLLFKKYLNLFFLLWFLKSLGIWLRKEIRMAAWTSLHESQQQLCIKLFPLSRFHCEKESLFSLQLVMLTRRMGEGCCVCHSMISGLMYFPESARRGPAVLHAWYAWLHRIGSNLGPRTEPPYSWETAS